MSWTCQRQSQSTKCGYKNDSRKRKCARCGKPRPVKRKPAHMSALDLSYEGYILLNGGEYCGICGRKRSSKRRLDRDHDHKTGQPRGLLCSRCNRALPNHIDVKWLQNAIVYLNKINGV